jgi:hypothetical protein
MKGLSKDLIQFKSITALAGVTVAFVVSILPFGSMLIGPPPRGAPWTNTEIYSAALVLVGGALLLVSDARHLRLCERSKNRTPKLPDDAPHLLGFFLYAVGAGYMIFGAGNMPELHLVVFATAALFCGNRLILLGGPTKEGPIGREGRIFIAVYLLELVFFGFSLWFLFFRGA